MDRQECLSHAANETGGWVPIRNHHDLFHLLALRLQDPARKPQALGGVGVIWANLGSCEFCEWKFFGAIVEKHNLQRVAGILSANQMCESEGNLLRGGKTIFAIKNHRMRTVEHHDRGAG